MATDPEQDKPLPLKVEDFLYAYELVFESKEFDDLRVALEALRASVKK